MKQLSTNFVYRRTAVIFSVVLAVTFTFIVAQSLIAAGGETAARRAGNTPANQTGVITITGNAANDPLLAYKQAHYTTGQAAPPVTTPPPLPDPAPVAEEVTPPVVNLGLVTPVAYLPIMFNPPPKLAITVTRANSANQWTVSWKDGGAAVTAYELQEAQKADFSDASTIYNGTNLQHLVATHAPSFNNEYYYRVRAVVGTQVGPWSDTGLGVGAYLDNFTDNTSGWAIRRTTFLEEVRTWYENHPAAEDDWQLIIQVEDSWDWGISSPLRRAPAPPYAIEYKAMPANLGNLVSHGAVFGGDWNGQSCPDYSSLDGVYRHNICFNHFYNTNTIWFSDLKLLFEKVDYLEWRPQDGGSPLKRGSYSGFTDWFEVNPLPHVSDPNGWNTYRIEVRQNSIKYFVNGNFVRETNATQWVNEPYFGVFASTDEYSNSTWRIDYYKVTPLDN